MPEVNSVEDRANSPVVSKDLEKRILKLIRKRGDLDMTSIYTATLNVLDDGMDKVNAAVDSLVSQRLLEYMDAATVDPSKPHTRVVGIPRLHMPKKLRDLAKSLLRKS